MGDIKILSFNVRGLRNFLKRKTVFSYLRKFKAHIILLQETHVLLEDEKTWAHDLKNEKLFFNPLNSVSCGQIFICNGDNFEIISHDIIVPGRLQILKIKLNESILSIFNIYGPNNEKEKLQFIGQLQEILNTYENDNYLIMRETSI